MCNYGEVFGPGCYFTADGSFAPVDGATRCPKDFTIAAHTHPWLRGTPLPVPKIAAVAYDETKRCARIAICCSDSSRNLTVKSFGFASSCLYL